MIFLLSSNSYLSFIPVKVVALLDLSLSGMRSTGRLDIFDSANRPLNKTNSLNIGMSKIGIKMI